MLTQEELKKHLDYNPATGAFFRISQDKKRNIPNKKINGKTSNGYVVIRVNGKKYKAHRLAWLYVYGSFPKGQIDHINRLRDDNRINNLRDVTPLENAQNASIRSDNTSGVIGVGFRSDINRWYATISVENRRVYLGAFIEFHEAVNARKNAEVLYGFYVGDEQ